MENVYSLINYNLLFIYFYQLLLVLDYIHHVTPTVRTAKIKIKNHHLLATLTFPNDTFPHGNLYVHSNYLSEIHSIMMFCTVSRHVVSVLLDDSGWNQGRRRWNPTKERLWGETTTLNSVRLDHKNEAEYEHGLMLFLFAESGLWPVY